MGEDGGSREREFLSSAPLFIELPAYFEHGCVVVHAGVLPGHTVRSTADQLKLTL